MSRSFQRGCGLSPRGRGKREQAPTQQIQTRSIPAWAGETALPPKYGNAIKVYPRVGGGNVNECLSSALR